VRQSLQWALRGLGHRYRARRILRIPPSRQPLIRRPLALANTGLDNVYIAPYKHFHDNPFQGLFDPTDPLHLLQGAITAVLPDSRILGTVTFTVDSQVQGGINNIPFVTNQANAARVMATFWIQRVQPALGLRDLFCNMRSECS
jgi:hypothetical protein